MKKMVMLIVFIFDFVFLGFGGNNPPGAFGPLPSESQLKWQELELYAFIHFSMNTFTDAEWGFGDKNPQLFNPDALDCKQWCRIIKKAGMKGVIITAKHHDGFCLWPSNYTEYNVKNSPWRNGKGDLIRELADACKEYDLKLGIYLSPWDRNNKDYGTKEYITYFRNQLKELLTNYGDIFEVWFDGANGGTGYYGGANENRSVDRKTYYDWQHTFGIVSKLQPKTLIFSDAGPHVRWCGNESGWIGETNWSLLRKDELWPGYPHYSQLQNGHENGTHWVPAEVNVSIRPGWFYHQSQDSLIKSPSQLLDIFYYSNGRNANLNINIPIDPRGLIHPNDSAALIGFANLLKKEFVHDLAKGCKIEASNSRGTTMGADKLIDSSAKTYWATEDHVKTASVTMSFKRPINCNRFLVQECISLGQRVKSFTLEAQIRGAWRSIATGTTIGYKRILKFPDVKTDRLRFTINDAKACPAISLISIYQAPESKGVSEEKTGMANNASHKSNWEVISGNRKDKALLFDNNRSTIFRQKERAIVVDLKKNQAIRGFQYLPNQEVGASGNIFNYQFSVSNDGKKWIMIKKGEFSNVQNNPILQNVLFNLIQARFVKLTVLSTVNENVSIECAELDLIIKR